MSAADEGLCPHRVPAGGWCAACDLYDEPATRVSAPDEATGSRGEVEAVLAEHRRVWDHYSPHCSCGKWRDKRDDGTMHAAHVAAALAPVLAEVRAEGAREFARAAYNEWPIGSCAHKCFREDTHIAPKDCLHGPDWLIARIGGTA